MLLVVGGIKGGSGKTTIATNLAVCCASRGKKVLLIDADEQQSALQWQAHRVSDVPIAVRSHVGPDLHVRISESLEYYEEIIVDTGGRDTRTQRAALVKCDVFLVPLRPKSLDVWTFIDVLKLSQEISNINPKIKIKVVLNQCSPRSLDTEQAALYINDYNVECLEITIGNRKSFSDASAEGLGILELKTADEKSIREILSLHDEIYRSDMLQTFIRDGRDIWLSHGR